MTRSYKELNALLSKAGPNSLVEVTPEELNIIKEGHGKVSGKNVLEKANGIVQQRGESYGHPYEDFSRTAKMWSAILGVEITPDQCVKCMIAVKLSRLSETPQHQDSVDDLAGYTWCLDEILKVMRGVDITA